MKEHWYRWIERKDREAEYFKTQALCIAGDVSNIKDGFEKLRDALNEYHGALFPWLPSPADLQKTENGSIIDQMEAEMEYLKTQHVFETSYDGGTMTLKLPAYMIGTEEEMENKM